MRCAQPGCGNRRKSHGGGRLVRRSWLRAAGLQHCALRTPRRSLRFAAVTNKDTFAMLLRSNLTPARFSVATLFGWLQGASRLQEGLEGLERQLRARSVLKSPLCKEAWTLSGSRIACNSGLTLKNLSLCSTSRRKNSTSKTRGMIVKRAPGLSWTVQSLL